MTLKVKIFKNVSPDSSTGHQSTFRDQIWWKSAIAKLPKGHVDYHTKKLSLCGSRPSPTWADHAKNCLNVVTPWHVRIYWIWSGLAALCRTYSGKIDFSAQKVNTITAYNYCKIAKQVKHKKYSLQFRCNGYYLLAKTQCKTRF